MSESFSPCAIHSATFCRCASSRFIIRKAHYSPRLPADSTLVCAHGWQGPRVQGRLESDMARLHPRNCRGRRWSGSSLSCRFRRRHSRRRGPIQVPSQANNHNADSNYCHDQSFHNSLSFCRPKAAGLHVPSDNAKSARKRAQGFLDYFGQPTGQMPRERTAATLRRQALAGNSDRHFTRQPDAFAISTGGSRPAVNKHANKRTPPQKPQDPVAEHQSREYARP